MILIVILIIIVMVVQQECQMMKTIPKYVRIEKSFKIKYIFKYTMLIDDLPLDIKKLVLSYSLGDVKLLKIKNSSIVKKLY